MFRGLARFLYCNLRKIFHLSKWSLSSQLVLYATNWRYFAFGLCSSHLCLDGIPRIAYIHSLCHLIVSSTLKPTSFPKFSPNRTPAWGRGQVRENPGDEVVRNKRRESVLWRLYLIQHILLLIIPSFANTIRLKQQNADLRHVMNSKRNFDVWLNGSLLSRTTNLLAPAVRICRVRALKERNYQLPVAKVLVA